MGGRGSSTSGGATGGADPLKITSETSLISMRERFPKEVDEALAVMRHVEDRYGVILEDSLVVSTNPNVMGYYDSSGKFAINEPYFNSEKMNKSYDECVEVGFHPPRGDKTGIEAVTAHELGHRLTDIAGRNAGYGEWAIDKVSNEIVRNAAHRMGRKSDDMSKAISGYADQHRKKYASHAETISEAYADVFCNGRNAKQESRAVIRELNRYFEKGEKY